MIVSSCSGVNATAACSLVRNIDLMIAGTFFTIALSVANMICRLAAYLKDLEQMADEGPS
jgi:hypothetical protein